MYPPLAAPASARVLLVDDSELVRDMVAAELGEWGYEALPADCGQAGIALFEREGADVVVTDISMPDMSGIELLRHVKAASPDTPVIMLSLNSQLATVLDAVRLGAFDYVIKDQRLDALRAAIQRASEQLNLRRENARLVVELHQANVALEGRVAKRTELLRQTNESLKQERRKLQQTLSRLHETQSQLMHAEKMATVGLLTAGVAHEINAPLGFVLPNFTILRNWCDAIVSGPPGGMPQPVSETLELIRQMKAALIRIRDIVHDLGLFSRRSMAARERVDLKSVVDSVLRLFGSQFRERAQVELVVDGLPAVCGDATQLRQVFLNLIVNAVQAISPDSSDGVVRIVGRDAGSHVEVDISHNGTPLSAELVERILNPVFASGFATQGAHAGLTVSLHLVERMGGMVKLDAERHDATTLLIRLPCWREQRDPPSIAPESSKSLRE